jgi:23S rRNA maturation-related 3'-5' exoribonuclease YhaM
MKARKNRMRSKIIELLRSTERPGIENLIEYMEGKGGFFDAPCSSQYHLSKIGGLAEHSVNVFDTMISLHQSNAIAKVLDTSFINSIIIVSLLHDLGKATYRSKPNYTPNILKSGKQSDSKPFETNKDRLYIPHEVISLQIISNFIELTEHEEYAIYAHNGLYTAAGREISGKEQPLQLLLHFADMFCSRFVEVEKEVE